MDVAKFNFDYSKQGRFYFGLFSDTHLDSPTHDKKRFESDMDYVANLGGRISINGDIGSYIFPTDHKRYSRAGNQSNEDAQVNSVADYIVDRLSAWADNIDLLAYGNHEVTVVKYNNSDILQLIVSGLNRKRSKNLPPIKRSGYVGFINLVFSRGDNEGVKRYVIWRDHGKGGNSPVTVGTIPLNRMYTTYDADCYWIGHSHNGLVDTSHHSIGVSSQGNIYDKGKIGIITPGYDKNFSVKKYTDNTLYRLNFAEEKFISPTSLGYGLLTIDVNSSSIDATAHIV